MLGAIDLCNPSELPGAHLTYLDHGGVFVYLACRGGPTAVEDAGRPSAGPESSGFPSAEVPGHSRAMGAPSRWGSPSCQALEHTIFRSSASAVCRPSHPVEHEEHTAPGGEEGQSDLRHVDDRLYPDAVLVQAHDGDRATAGSASATATAAHARRLTHGALVLAAPGPARRARGPRQSRSPVPSPR